MLSVYCVPINQQMGSHLGKDMNITLITGKSIGGSEGSSEGSAERFWLGVYALPSCTPASWQE